MSAVRYGLISDYHLRTTSPDKHCAKQGRSLEPLIIDPSFFLPNRERSARLCPSPRLNSTGLSLLIELSKVINIDNKYDRLCYFLDRNDCVSRTRNEQFFLRRSHKRHFTHRWVYSSAGLALSRGSNGPEEEPCGTQHSKKSHFCLFFVCFHGEIWQLLYSPTAWDHRVVNYAKSFVEFLICHDIGS